MNPPGETAPPSPLEKPLGELTEDDIAQLTREDCRKFLKDRGMRRPSWNKSQAIQQVISLKALLEGRPDPDDSPTGAAEAHHKPPLPPQPHQQQQQQSGDPAPSPYRRRDPPPPPPSAARGPAAESVYHSPSSRSEPFAAAADAPVGQMTIFYGGRVSVYDGVPAEKARAIMQLAASPGVEDSSLFRSPPDPVGTSARLFGGQRRDSATQEWRASRETEPEGPASRKASLQRYLEKRKDRFKGKRVIGVPTPSNMEVTYLPQKFRGAHEQPSRSDTTSPTQPRPPGTPTRSSSIENKAPKLHISVDLNEDGGGK